MKDPKVTRMAGYKFYIPDEMDDVSDWAKEAMHYCIAAGIINGDDERRFNPRQTANRAEAAKIIYGVIGLTERN